MNNDFFLGILPFLYQLYWVLNLKLVCTDYHMGNLSYKKIRWSNLMNW